MFQVERLFVQQIEIYEYTNKILVILKCVFICVFTNKTTFRTKQIHIRRCAKEKTFAETENGDLFICIFVYSPTKSQPERSHGQTKNEYYLVVAWAFEN